MNPILKTPQDSRSREHYESNSDSASSRSPSFIDEAMDSLRLEEKLSSKAILNRFFSAGSVIPTSSSNANRNQQAFGTRSGYTQIGSGTCADVFEVPGAVHVFKAAKHPGKETDTLWNDYRQHTLIQEVFDTYGRSTWTVRVPRCFWFVGQDDERWWEENVNRFPKQPDQWTNILCSERILPIPRPLRHALIEEYCPKSGFEAAKELKSNKHCLVRLYLGKRRTRVNTLFFNLRNFNLNLDQMEDLNLDVRYFAVAIAEAMAVMHWICWLDANDVEFVLGSSPDGSADANQIVAKPLTNKDLEKMAPNTSTWDAHLQDFKTRQIHIWMLDFNRCRSFRPDDLGPLVHSFFINDPYFPRPYGPDSKDYGLWALFRDTYVERGIKGLKCTGKDEFAALPARTMELIETEQKRRDMAKGAS
ncbi:hypothetical protein C7974DRAFT_418989 [Boeremia exigua]|uniref:uncharacterized protein n=1 Tax=Boeremia exigua TaxID=749465 RepID=UPI001E8DEC11|nr:uncharacterized protein C7974DRAFT_418989 [Boeremia exigua]KAH6612088.1 hypothetical protein C7974DRAFT_418989 [Boeremia exigua]